MHVLYFSYSANDVHDAEFFSMDDDRVVSILQNHSESSLVMNFISKFNFHKGLMLSSVPENNISVEEMDIDSFLNAASNDYEMIQNKVKNTSAAGDVLHFIVRLSLSFI